MKKHLKKTFIYSLWCYRHIGIAFSRNLVWVWPHNRRSKTAIWWDVDIQDTFVTRADRERFWQEYNDSHKKE